MLYIAQLIGIPIGIITTSIITRVFGPDNYGVFAFYITVTGFLLLFFRFGFASSGGLLLAQVNDEYEMRKLIGSMIVIFLVVGSCYSLFIFSSSFFVDIIFHTSISKILKLMSILLIIMPFQFMINSIARGTNKIGILSLYQVIPKSISLLGILILFAFHKLNVISLIILTTVVLITFDLMIIGKLKPSFDELKANIKKLWLKNKEYGFHLYLGQISDQPTYGLDGILISYLTGTTELGFYGLARIITSPMPMLSQSLGASLFRDFAHQERIPKKIIYFNFLWLVCCTIIIILIGRYIVVLLFSERYLPVASLITPWAIANFFSGAYQPYNVFLGARGERRIGYLAFITTPINIIGNLILIPIYGAFGAAVASMISMFSWYILFLLLYSKYIDNLKKQNDV